MDFAATVGMPYKDCKQAGVIVEPQLEASVEGTAAKDFAESVLTAITGGPRSGPENLQVPKSGCEAG